MQPCTQTETISNLKTNQPVFMEKLDTVIKKIDKIDENTEKIHEYIFEGGMKDDYTTKQEHLSVVSQIEDHKQLITWLSRAIIGGLLTMVLGLVIYIWNLFNK